MKSTLRPFVLLVMTLMIANLCSVESRNPVLHGVGGGRNTWNPNINFSDWSIHQHFFVGDWLYFGFDKQIYNVLEVNKTSYDKCYDQNYMTNVTRGGRDVFYLSEAKVYYFLCGRGFCSQGMKVEIPVEEIAPSPPPQPDYLTSDDDFQLSIGFSSFKFDFFGLIISSLLCLVLVVL